MQDVPFSKDIRSPLWWYPREWTSGQPDPLGSPLVASSGSCRRDLVITPCDSRRGKALATLGPQGSNGQPPWFVCVCSPLQAGNLRLTLVPWEGIVATQPSLSKREGTCYHLRLQATGMQTYGHSGTTRGASFGSHGGDPRMPRCIRKGTLEAQQRMTGTD